MAIDSNIIFSIGSKLGPGGFASLKAGIDMIGSMIGKVRDNIKELDQFSQAWQRANKQAVLMADSAAAGLIDTGAIIKQHNALMRSGVKLTDEQFKTIAVRTVELAQATGEDATAAFERLTKSIQTGSTRALREYGVDLKTSGTLTDRQNEAVKQLTKGFEGMTVSAETTSERLFALENNIGTTAGLLWSSSGSSNTLAYALSEVNTALGEFNRLMSEAPDAMSDFMFSAKGVKGLFAEMGNELTELVLGPLADFEDWLDNNNIKLTSILSKMPVVGPLFSGLAATGLGTREVKDLLQEELSGVAQFAWDENMSRIDAETQRRIEEGPPEIPGPEKTEEGPPEIPGPEKTMPPGRKSAGKELFDADQGFLQEDLEFQRMQEEFWTQQNKEREEQKEQARQREREAEFERIQESSEWQAEYFSALDEMEEEAAFRKENRFALMMGVEKKYIDASRKQWESGLQGKAQMMGMFFGSVASLMNTESEKMFKIGKVAAIAEALVNTYLGATKAFQAFAGLGPWGVALGAAAAAAVTAAGLANVARIRQQEFKGGGASSSPTMPSISSGSSMGSSSAIPSGATQTTTSTERQEMTVNIVMRDEGMGLFDVVMDQNDRASKDGRTSLITSGSTSGTSRAA